MAAIVVMFAPLLIVHIVAAAATTRAIARRSGSISYYGNRVNRVWPSKVISWWYACDNNWPLVIRQINTTARLPLVTSIQTYCGWAVADNGTIIGDTSAQCIDFFAEIIKLGVHPELTLGGGNCSIAAYRNLWRDVATSPRQLLRAALDANAKGWNIDLEPNCRGGSGPYGTAADAKRFARWLRAVRAALRRHGIRLTVDVASWSPVLRQFATLASSGVNRLQNMQTYTGNTKGQWDEWLDEFVNQRDMPTSKVGIGLGAWNDTKSDEGSQPKWWETPEGAVAKVTACIKAGVPELAVFRIRPALSSGMDEWPLEFWWDALAPFLQPSSKSARIGEHRSVGDNRYDEVQAMLVAVE